MPTTCCAFGCTSGYPAYPQSADVSFHKFPKNTSLRKEWIRRLHLEKLTVENVAHKSVCSLHFRKTYFKIASQDKHTTRQARNIEYVLKLWNVLNVKNPFLGGIKKDHTRDPILSDCPWQLQFLEDFAQFLEAWESLIRDTPKMGLSKPTFTTVKQTCRAMIEISKLCFEELGFNYVLLGKFTSDRLEGRFSWYRQLSGGNYYISVKQLLENERKIRTVSLLRFSHVSPRELATLDESESPRDALQQQAADMASKLSDSFADFDSDITASDANVIYYVTW